MCIDFDFTETISFEMFFRLEDYLQFVFRFLDF